MSPFNFETFSRLKKQETNRNGFASFSRMNWYQKSETYFLAHSLDNPQDLALFIVFAYSWMPKIPQVDFEAILDHPSLFSNLVQLRSEKISIKEQDVILKEILPFLIRKINNSMIGVSKMLYFISPGNCPILDKKVIEVWNLEFEDEYLHPSATSEITKTNDYLRYRKKMLQWLKEVQNKLPKITLRELEWVLFINHPSVT